MNDCFFSPVFKEYSFWFLSLDNDVWERRNVVYFLTVLKDFLNVFKKSFFAIFYS